MNTMSRKAIEEFGYHLWNHGFQPLPDVDDDGRLVGVRMWRPHAGHVEFLALRAPGVASAGRVAAEFSYHDPFVFGPVVDFRHGHALNALAWLLTSDEVSR